MCSGFDYSGEALNFQFRNTCPFMNQCPHNKKHPALGEGIDDIAVQVRVLAPVAEIKSFGLDPIAVFSEFIMTISR
jgi:hypothetical protein